MLPEIIELWGLNVQLGIHISELELLTIGTVNDMYTEMNNDVNREAYSTLASQFESGKFQCAQQVCGLKKLVFRKHNLTDNGSCMYAEVVKVQV